MGLLHGVHRTTSKGWEVLGGGTAGLFSEGQASVNLVAAVPSLHSAFSALVAMFLWGRVPPAPAAAAGALSAGDGPDADRDRRALLLRRAARLALRRGGDGGLGLVGAPAGGSRAGLPHTHRSFLTRITEPPFEPHRLSLLIARPLTAEEAFIGSVLSRLRVVLVGAVALIASAASVAPAIAADASFSGASSDGTRVFFTTAEPLDPVADTDDGALDVYQRLGGVTTLVSGGGNDPFADASFAGASSDGTRVFFTTSESLDPVADTDGGRTDVYERSGGVTTLVSGDADSGAYNADFNGASSDGTRVFFTTAEPLDPVADTDAQFDVYERSGGVTTLVSGDADGAFDATFNGASSDGTRVFFTTAEPLDPVADTDAQSDVYMRRLTVPDTTLVSADGGGASDGAFDASFSGASSDGTRVFFETAEPLVPSTDTDTVSDVYQRNLTFQDTTLVSGDADGSFRAEFAGASSDGTRVFFTTNESLDPVADTDGLWVDVYQRLGGVTTLVSGGGDGNFTAFFAGASSDGTRVFFTTAEPLDFVADTDAQLDVYQRSGGVTTLVSGDADGSFPAEFAGASSDGTRVFFETNESLDPVADTDGGEEDVYQRSGGVTTLVSGNGDDATTDASFAGASSDGTRVLFSTREALDPVADTDGGDSDVYQRVAGVTKLVSTATDPIPPDTTAPNTSLTKHPPKRVKSAKRKAKVKFAFASSEPGSTFSCQLDKGPFRPCDSPHSAKVKRGKHTFKVAATDAAGNEDPTLREVLVQSRSQARLKPSAPDPELPGGRGSVGTRRVEGGDLEPVAAVAQVPVGLRRVAAREPAFALCPERLSLQRKPSAWSGDLNLNVARLCFEEMVAFAIFVAGASFCLSVTFFVFVFSVPPVGVKVTSALTFTLPCFFRCFFLSPVGLTRSFTVPAPLTGIAAPVGALLWVTRSSPFSFSLPWPGTVTASFAVPLSLFSFGLSMSNWFEGGGPGWTSTVAVSVSE